MKKMKIALTILFIGAAFAISAFTQKENPVKKRVDAWFQYLPVNGNGPTDPANYVETTGGPACSDDSGVFCSVYAEADTESGGPGERIPLGTSLSDISTLHGFDDYVEGIVHMDDN
jgi:hypothetical protein